MATGLSEEKRVRQIKVLNILTCRRCQVMKRCCTPCALLYCGEWPYPTSRCRYVDMYSLMVVSHDSWRLLLWNTRFHECFKLSLQRTIYLEGSLIKILYLGIEEVLLCRSVVQYNNVQKCVSVPKSGNFSSV